MFHDEDCNLAPAKHADGVDDSCGETTTGYESRRIRCARKPHPKTQQHHACGSGWVFRWGGQW